MEFKELIGALEEYVGAEGGFPADEDGVVRVGVDDLSLAFMEVPETRTLLMWSALGRLPAEGAEALKTELLRANFMGRGVRGGALSLSDDDTIYAHATLSLQAADKESFFETLEAFVGTVVEWGRLIADYRPPAEPVAVSADAAAPGVGADGFIKI